MNKKSFKYGWIEATGSQGIYWVDFQCPYCQAVQSHTIQTMTDEIRLDCTRCRDRF